MVHGIKGLRLKCKSRARVQSGKEPKTPGCSSAERISWKDTAVEAIAINKNLKWISDIVKNLNRDNVLHVKTTLIDN